MGPQSCIPGSSQWLPSFSLTLLSYKYFKLQNGLASPFIFQKEQQKHISFLKPKPQMNWERDCLRLYLKMKGNALFLFCCS